MGTFNYFGVKTKEILKETTGSTGDYPTSSNAMGCVDVKVKIRVPLIPKGFILKIFVCDEQNQIDTESVIPQRFYTYILGFTINSSNFNWSKKFFDS